MANHQGKNLSQRSTATNSSIKRTYFYIQENPTIKSCNNSQWNSSNKVTML